MANPFTPRAVTIMITGGRTPIFFMVSKYLIMAFMTISSTLVEAIRLTAFDCSIKSASTASMTPVRKSWQYVALVVPLIPKLKKPSTL